jgi:tRNA A-37 threonylcarbamoyl transferase component Bud32
MMAFFEKQKEPLKSAGTCSKCSKPVSACICQVGDQPAPTESPVSQSPAADLSAARESPAAQNADSLLSDTHTTFSELSGRSLKDASVEDVLTTTSSKERRRPQAPTNQPERIGDRYKIEELIGIGGMGAVYRGKHEAMGKTLAVKVLHEDAVANKKAVLRFDQEARAASALTHPHLVSVYDYGVTDDGAPYLVMDYLEGKSLSAIIKEEGRLNATRALTIFIQIAEGIEHAHKKGVIHRDLKPSNVIITKTDREQDFVKIVDFGIAKLMPAALGAEANSLTQTGEIFGSPLYMSPEQCTGQQLDQRSDIYSLGCLMYETVTGRPPLQGANPVQTIMMHVQDDAPSIASTGNNITLPPGLETVIMRCLNKAPIDRYPSAEALMSDLEKVRAGGKLINRGALKRFLRAVVPRDRRGMLIRAVVFGLLLSLPLAGSYFLYERLFPDQITTIVEKGDQAMKEPLDPITAEACYDQAIKLGLDRKINPERQALLYDKLAYCYLRQAKVNQINQDSDKTGLAQHLVSDFLGRAFDQYKLALDQALKAHNDYLIAKEEFGVAGSLRENSDFLHAQEYYDDCVVRARKARTQGENILGPALLNRARNLHTLRFYKDSIRDAMEATRVYDKPILAEQLNCAAAYEIAGDSATASAAAFSVGGNSGGAAKLFEEADRSYAEAAKILSALAPDNKSPQFTAVTMSHIEMLKQQLAMLKQQGKSTDAITQKLNDQQDKLKAHSK